jgi:translation initiation factor IF-1
MTEAARQPARVSERSRVVVATVMEELPSLLYRVQLENRQQVTAHPAGGAKRNFVRLLPGDRVELELSPHDYTRGRILKKV